MGNRAVITTAPYDQNSVGIYVHWNGGQESVEGFAKACKELGYRDPTQDCYGVARLIESIALFFGSDGRSVGVDVCHRLDEDNGDNGVWLIGPDWTVSHRDRKFPVETPADWVTRDAIAADIIRITQAAEAARAARETV